jgi:hypothetical protein
MVCPARHPGPPTHRHDDGVTISRLAIFGVVGGRIRGNWNVVDMLGALHQLRGAAIRTATVGRTTALVDACASSVA